MAHYEREELLYRTLWAYRHQHTPEELKDVEFVIVDDAGGRSKTFWKIIKIHRNAGLNITAAGIDEGTTNACVPLNFAVRLAIGDIIVLTNAENFPAVEHILTSIKDRMGNKVKRYLSCGCYSLSKSYTDRFKKFEWENKEQFEKAIEPIVTRPQAAGGSGCEGWYNHSKHRPAHLYFLVAMRKVVFEALGGFDERYASGYAFEDSDFTRRIKRAKIEIAKADDIYCYHQYHFNSAFRGSSKRYIGVVRNSRIYKNSDTNVMRNNDKWGIISKKRIVRSWFDGDRIERDLFYGIKYKRNNGSL